MKKLTTFGQSPTSRTSILKLSLCMLVILAVAITSNAEAQEIVSKPESIKVYAHKQTISIEARKEIDYLELWDVKKTKRRLKFKPKNQSIRVNTQRLKKSDYQIVLFFGNDTKLIKFTK